MPQSLIDNLTINFIRKSEELEKEIAEDQKIL